MGNRKPRRVQKGHPHAGRMGGDNITVMRVPLLAVHKATGEEIVVVK